MTSHPLDTTDLVWALGSCCALTGRPFDAEAVARQFPPPCTVASLVTASRELEFEATCAAMEAAQVAPGAGHLLLLVREGHAVRPGLLVRTGTEGITWIPACSTEALCESLETFGARFTGHVVRIRPLVEAPRDAGEASTGARFGFRWFVPELLKHRKVWRDVLAASLVLQLLALGLPLFTQAIIDKVVVHQTESTLIALAIGMGVFLAGTAILSWVRQYLVLHTGNRVDAVLGATVVDHLFKLPLRYFEHRPTGVVAARLQGVETIREFVSSAAVSLILDIPFLLIAVAVMFWYSVPLTLVALGMLAMIAAISALMAPVFQVRLNEQFMLAARNQAFLTEYIAGLETVKSLQFEPQIRKRYGGYLASYLQSGFRTRQIGNTYQVAASTLEQAMTLMILLGGAWIVMHPRAGGEVFTIGMLVAFQMFAGKLSQPVMRIVGLWQQFQQARLAVQRLGDLMNAPAEPYSLAPSRQGGGQGRIDIARVSFRYGEDRPFLYEGFSLRIEPGQVVAIMGPSGSGKSTLAKLLQGFYSPTGGQIKVDGIDIRHLSANELRANFGVVPQETVLFSGTVFDNLAMAAPHASFDQVVRACRMAEIHTAIEALPQGYQTPIGERGAGLSGGQKQRLAIARALLKRPKVLIFDEATSALDAQTAEHFAKTVNALRGQVTMIFITHALPRSLRVDRVVTLGDGAACNGPAPADARGVIEPQEA